MRIVMATDDATAAIVDKVERMLRGRGHEVTRLPVGAWGSVGVEVGRRVAAGEADQGVVLCFTGTGVAMAANKVRGIRAALCVDAATAAGARRWNDANVLALSLRLLTEGLAAEILDGWLDTEYARSEAESLSAMSTYDA